MAPNAQPQFPEALQAPLFHALAQVANTQGLALFVIGGYVRDWLLNTPCMDVDVVVLGDGPAAAKAFAQQVGAGNLAVYGQYGTAMVETDGFRVEFVGARKESYAPESRKPKVAPGSLHDDQLRRDFTINALSLSLNANDFGTLLDPFGGLADLAKGIIRTPTDPDITFSDDPLRMLRGIRFAARLGYAIEDVTYNGIVQNAGRIKIISTERVAEELNKMLQTGQPGRAFNLLHRTGLLPLVFPDLARMHGVEVRNGVGHKDNLYHTLKVLDNIVPHTDNLWLRWAALLHDIGKPRTKRFSDELGWTFHGHDDLGARMVPKLFAALKLPLNEKMRYVQKLVGLHQRPIALAAGEVSDSAIRRIVVDAAEDLDDLLTLCRADITTKDPRKHERYLRNYEALEKRIYEVQERDALRNWQPPVTGEDIMAAFGLKPSKAVGEIKQAVRDAVLDGLVPNNRTAALDYMRKVADKYIIS